VHLIEVELLVGCMHSEVVSSGSSTLHSSSKGVPNESALEHLKIHSTFSSGGFSNNLFAPYAWGPAGAKERYTKGRMAQSEVYLSRPFG
jgi:hypothetical protein